MLNLEFEPLTELMQDELVGTRHLFKKRVFDDFRSKSLTGSLDAHLEVDFNPLDGSDILVRKVDPENALGYSVFSDPGEYYQSLAASLYEPTEEDIQGALDG